jgi:prolyl oligopeptidase
MTPARSSFRPVRLVTLLLPLATLPAGGSAQSGPHPPATDTLHGVEVVDPYRWLEDTDAREVREWTYVRDGLARSFAARQRRRTGFRSQIEIIGTRKVVSAPFRRGGRLLFARFDPTGPDRAISVVAVEGDGGEKEVVHPDSFRAATGETPLRFFPSLDGTRVAVASSRSGEVWERVRVVRVDTPGTSPRAVELPELHGTLSSVVWTPGGRGFYYESYEHGPGRGVVG